MFDHAALDVALGLVFLYLVLSLVCSAANETLSSVFAWRADFLKQGLANLLQDPGLLNRIYSHPLVGALIRPARDVRPQGVLRIKAVRSFIAWWRRERYPSYLPSRTFVSALLDLEPRDPKKRADAAARSLEKTISEIPSEPVRRALATLLDEAEAATEQATEQVEHFRAGVEKWFDDSMTRVSGWYRRRIQLVLWIVGLALAIALNADTIQIARVLWSDEATRTALVAQAEQAASGDQSLDQLQAEADKLRKALPVPLGWHVETRPDGYLDWLERILTKSLGILLTAAALSLGAPFWFDLLSKIARLRSTGSPPPSPAARKST